MNINKKFDEKEEFWANKPETIFNNFNILIDMNKDDEIIISNKLIRIAILSFIFINLSNVNKKLLVFPILIAIISYFIVTSNNMETNVEKAEITKENPYMNFTVGEQLKKPARNNKFEESRKQFLEGDNLDGNYSEGNNPYIKYNLTDFFNRNYSDRSFYTMPVTTAMNDQKGFAESLFGDIGLCKQFGENCVKNYDGRMAKGRYYFSY